MGGGGYSFSARSVRTEALNYSTNSIQQNFTERKINNLMDPHGVKIRESRDSEEHPNSLAIIISLDVTASMGSIPQNIVSEGLPNIMKSIMERGIKDPQLLFVGIGDHECDRAPLQVGQFESSDELLDEWLTKIYMEHGGGGNDGESYLLSWYFASRHTSIDCFEKREQKGFLFTIGDEPTLRTLPGYKVKDIMGEGEYHDYTSMELLEKARETYNVYHLHVKEGANGRSQHVMNGWKELMGENLVIVDNHEDISRIISDIVTKNTNSITKNVPVSETSNVSEDVSEDNNDDEEMIL